MPSFLVRDAKVIRLQENIYASANTYVPNLSPAGSYYFFMSQSAAAAGFTGTELYKLIPYTERLNIFLTRMIFMFMAWSATFREVVNWASRKMIRRILAKFRKEEGEGKKEPTSKLSRDFDWTQKYRKPAEAVLRNWKMTVAWIRKSNSNITAKDKRWQISTKFQTPLTKFGSGTGPSIS